MYSVGVNAADLYLLARKLHQIAVHATAAPGETTGTPVTTAVVADVLHHDATSVGEIAARTQLAQSIVSSAIAGLVKKGVLSTGRDPNDGRRTVVSVIPEVASDLRTRGAQPLRGPIAAALPGLSDAKLERFEQDLERLWKQVATNSTPNDQSTAGAR